MISRSAIAGEGAARRADGPVIVIRPSKGWASLDLHELWGYRELLYFFAWRDIKVRYKQTVLGGAWAIIQPFVTMIVFSVVFGRLAKVPSDGLPYPVFAYCALLPWNYFSHALNGAANSLLGNERLISKVYFPRLAAPLAAVTAPLVDLAVAFTILIGMMFYYHVVPGAAVLALPLFVLMAVGTALGVGLWLAAFNVQYRDVRHVLPFLTQLWLLATPVAYPGSLVPESWRGFYALNPMAGVVEGFRWALLGKGVGPGPVFTVSAGVAVALLASGVFYFRRMERTFADWMAA